MNEGLRSLGGVEGTFVKGHTAFLVAGLLTATVSSEVFRAAQPALLYLVPFTLLPLLTMAYLKVARRCSPSFIGNIYTSKKVLG